MTRTLKFYLTAACMALASSLPLHAAAGILDDNEARKAILDLRAKVEAVQREVNARIDTKADKSAALNLVNQNEQTMAELAKLRGQIEVLSNEVANLQRKQNELYASLDARILALEPRKVTIDGAEAAVSADEQATYDSATATLKAGDYKTAALQLSEFVRRFPQSGYAANAQYLLGSSYYGQRDCTKAIAAHQVVATNYPDSPKAPDAMSIIATCYEEQKNKKAAAKTLRDLIVKYPDSSAAVAARERLPSLK